KSLVQLVGDVSKADRKLVAFGNHRRLRIVQEYGGREHIRSAARRAPGSVRWPLLGNRIGVAAGVSDRAPDPLGGGRHIDMLDAQRRERIEYRVDDGLRRGD